MSCNEKAINAMNNKKLAFQISTIILVFAITLFFPRAALSKGEITHVYVDPSTTTVKTCCTQTIVVRVENAVDLTGYHLEINFDKTVIQVIDIVNGGFLDGDIGEALYEPSNEIDNTIGFISFGMVQQNSPTNPLTPKSGEGDLIEITLQALVPNQTSKIEIDSENSILVNWPDVSAIEFTAADGLVDTESCAPTNIALSGYSIPENEPTGTEIGTFVTVDPDVPNDSFTYAFVSGDGDDDNASFEIAGSSLQSKDIFNYEVKSVYQIRVRSTDLGNKMIEKMLLVFIRDVNDLPVANDQDVYTEEVPIEITLTAFDEDGDPLDYDIVSTPADGVLTGTAPNLIYTPDEDFIGVDSFTFKVNDGLDDSEIATVSIIIDAKKGVDYYYPLFMNNN